jgi:Holliday junction resolvase
VGKSERSKGARGEREVAAVLREHGFEAERNRVGTEGDDVTCSIPGISLEVKRAETLKIPMWTRQAEEQAGSREPVLVYRSNSQPWRAVVRFDYLLRLLKGQA